MNFLKVLDKILVEESEIFVASLRRRVCEVMGMPLSAIPNIVSHAEPVSGQTHVKRNVRQATKKAAKRTDKVNKHTENRKAVLERRRAIYDATTDTPLTWREIVASAKIIGKPLGNVLQDDLTLLGKIGAVERVGFGPATRWKRGKAPFDAQAIKKVAYG